MKKSFILLCMVILAFGMVLNASAIEFSGTASGEWTNEMVTASDVYLIQNNDVGGTATFKWGIPAADSFESVFSFNGAGSDSSSGWTFNTVSDDAFRIGDFSYQNGAVYNANGVTGISLDVSLLITSPTNITNSYLFDFSIMNTSNVTGDDVLDGDIVTSVFAFSDTTFMYNEVAYTLELLGFSNNGGSTIFTDFSSPENATASAGVYARITSDIPAPVPEPATILLLGSGLAGLAFYRRKRK